MEYKILSHGQEYTIEKNSEQERKHFIYLLKQANEALRASYNALNGINFMTPEGTPGRTETALDRTIKQAKSNIEEILNKGI